MTWEKKKVLITVKAYPEKSKKYGTVVCTAGLTEGGEWIRLYPLPFSSFIGNGISRYDWIEILCKRSTKEKLKRKESYKVKSGSIKVIDSTLRNHKEKWELRNRRILKNVAPSLEYLQESFKNDKTSLGLIKPVELIDFYKTDELRIYEEKSWFQQTLDGKKTPVLQEIPHIFKYKFKCDGCIDNIHDIQCEDWELLESYRKWGPKYDDVKVLWEKIYEKYFKWMKKRDLYFYVGTYSLYPTWLIIGLYYPPIRKEKNLLDWIA
ncbi:MAG: hypothetical protein PVF58_17585 [Candidatus Methanofastidiosia archaeon]